MSSILDAAFDGPIICAPTKSDRLEYLRDEIVFAKELLEDYFDVKWVYEALVNLTLDIANVGGELMKKDDKLQVMTWLEKLRALDGKRHGRWNALQSRIDSL